MVRNIIWIILIGLVAIFVNLGGNPLLDPDEPVYAQTPKEMIETGDYISPRIFGSYWYDKPPMYYWLVAGSFKIFGVNEFAARFPSASLAIICAIGIYFSCRKLINERAGFISAIVLLTSLEYFYLGKAAVTDITLCTCLTMSLLAFLHKKYEFYYFFAGLAVVTKGPIGLFFPAVIVFVYLVCTRQAKQLLSIKLPRGILIFLCTILPWYGAMYFFHGKDFIETFLGFHNITRFTTPEHSEGVLWYYFIPVLLIGFFPWTSLLIQSFWRSFRSEGEEQGRLVFFHIWSLIVFLFFSVSQTKLVSYILPMYPPLAILVGWYIDQAAQRRYQARVLWGWMIISVIFTTLFCVGLKLGVQEMPILATSAWYVGAVFICMSLGTVFFVWKKELISAFWVNAVGITVFSLILVVWMLPLTAGTFSVKQTSAEFKKVYDGVTPVYIMKFLRPGIAFYTDIYGEEIKNDEALQRAILDNPKGYFIIRRSEYNRLQEAEKKVLKVVSENDGKLILQK